MRLPNGRRYADYDGPVMMRDRLTGLWRAATRPRPRRWLNPRHTGAGHMLNRELGWWTVRPMLGWRSRRWVSKPTYATRAIPGDDLSAAKDWMRAALEIA